MSELDSALVRCVPQLLAPGVTVVRREEDGALTPGVVVYAGPAQPSAGAPLAWELMVSVEVVSQGVEVLRRQDPSAWFLPVWRPAVRAHLLHWAAGNGHPLEWAREDPARLAECIRRIVDGRLPLGRAVYCDALAPSAGVEVGCTLPVGHVGEEHMALVLSGASPAPTIWRWSHGGDRVKIRGLPPRAEPLVFDARFPYEPFKGVRTVPVCAVPCPSCLAPPGLPCRHEVGGSAGTPRRQLHIARRRACTSGLGNEKYRMTDEQRGIYKVRWSSGGPVGPLPAFSAGVQAPASGGGSSSEGVQAPLNALDRAYDRLYARERLGGRFSSADNELHVTIRELLAQGMEPTRAPFCWRCGAGVEGEGQLCPGCRRGEQGSPE